ncbi:MAG: ABC-2 family transporter protein [Thermomicrobiales bacterium]
MTRMNRLLAAYTRRSVLEWLGYRSFLTTLIFNTSIAPLLGLALWSAALPDRQGISAYFLALLVVQWATASQEYYSVTMVIYQGDLTDELLRPHPQVVSPIAVGLAFRFWNLAVGLPFLALTLAIAGTNGLAIGNIFQAIPAIAIAMMLHFAFTYALCLSALWVQQAGAITDIGSTLVVLAGGIAIPLMLLPEPARQVLAALPFHAMAGFPAEIASSQLSTSQVGAGYLMQGGWLLVFVATAIALWRTGIRHYAAVGG